MKAGRLLLVSPLFLFFGSGGALAKDSVDSRLQKLEETVRVLEGRIATLEGQIQANSPPTSAPSGLAKWRKLKDGMSEGDVEKLLGSPDKIDNYGSFSIWRYGRGRVQFDSRHALDSWHEP